MGTGNIKELRSFFDYEIKVISKIESINGLNNLDSICDQSDGVLIDRGDLSRDVPLRKIPYAQKHIIDVASKFSKPIFIVFFDFSSPRTAPKP